MAMPEPWRYYLAGALHSAGLLWITGWATSHWVISLQPLFGPIGWLAVPVALTLITLSIPLLVRSKSIPPSRVASDRVTPAKTLQRSAAGGDEFPGS
jgi:hypothetical protein